MIGESVLEEAQDSSVATLSFQLFPVFAVALASIAVLTDSSVLVIAAMVVGSEFGAVSGACVGLVFGRWRLFGQATGLLLGSFAAAVVVVAVLALGARRLGLLTVSDLTAPRPQTD